MKFSKTVPFIIRTYLTTEDGVVALVIRHDSFHGSTFCALRKILRLTLGFSFRASKHPLQFNLRSTVELTCNDFGYKDVFSSVPTESLSFSCIRVRLHRHFAHSDAFRWSLEVTS